MDLYIIGAGDVGGFIAYHAHEMGSFCVKAFLDDDSQKHEKYFFDLPVVGGIDFLQQIHSVVAVTIAIANPFAKKKIASKLKENPLIKFPKFIHPTVWLGEKVRVEEGCIIYPGVTINYETAIESFATINMNSAIGHNCSIGKFSTISPGVNCGGFTTLGNQSFLGIGCNTLQSISIGEEVIVGAGAVVIKDVPDRVTAVGNPARILKNRKP